MSSTGSNPMDAVSALMQERQRVEAWLAALESKRAITPPHVYDRVRADYDTRLREVTQKLAGRTTELRDMVGALTARMAKLQTEENAKRDERYEAELRATVGEMDASKWEALRTSIDAAITRLMSERTSVSTELARVQQIMSMAGGESGTGAKAPPPPVPPSATRSGGYSSQPSGGVATQSGATPAAGAPGTPPVPRPPTGSTGRQPTQPAVPNPPAASGSNPVQPAAVPDYLKDVPTEATKSLKCQECGTMNNPTEWYCERCGGELAAM
jgi:hypothetical protein